MEGVSLNLGLGGIIKFRIFPEFLDRERCKFREAFEKCQNYTSVDIFWDILDKKKGNLGQQCVKKSFYPSRASLK